MTDAELVAKKLAFIETCVNELRTLARPERIADDLREERFVEHTLQLAIQAALDVGSHIVSDDRLGEPETSRDVFRLLGRAGVLSADLSGRLEQMAGFRNVVVHLYQEVDLTIVRNVVEHHLGDLLEFVTGVRRKL
ncbi:MAG TPA: DUF86 domain-containing protein [Vicinamibacteria bacterium]|nr:DUF86 domain-containing protein [Vicinamibacteria bacterium]